MRKCSRQILVQNYTPPIKKVGRLQLCACSLCGQIGTEVVALCEKEKQLLNTNRNGCIGFFLFFQASYSDRAIPWVGSCSLLRRGKFFFFLLYFGYIVLVIYE